MSFIYVSADLHLSYNDVTKTAQILIKYRDEAAAFSAPLNPPQYLPNKMKIINAYQDTEGEWRMVGSGELVKLPEKIKVYNRKSLPPNGQMI